MNIQRILIAAAITGAISFAQSPSKDVSNISNVIRSMDFGVFGGFTGYKMSKLSSLTPANSELDEGGVAGFRAGKAFTEHFSLEGAYSYARNNLVLFTPNAGRAGFGARNHALTINPVWYFKAADSKWRPYLTAGFGEMWFQPTSQARSQGASSPYAQLGASQIDTKVEPAFNWGGGLKWNLTKIMNLRFDARNIWAANPHFNIPSTPNVTGGYYIPVRGWQNGAQVTAGLGFNFGEAAAAPAKIIKVSLSGDSSPILIGQTRAITETIEGAPNGKVTTNWTLNGSKINVDGNTYTFDSSAHPAGTYKLCASAEAKGYTPGSSCVDLTSAPQAIKELSASVAADKSNLIVGGSDTIHATTNLAAGVTPTYSWTVNGQKVAETGPDFAFNTQGLAPGTYNICYTVSAPGYADAQKCTQVVVECGNPTISISGGGTQEIASGDSARVPATATPNACGTPVKINYQVSEGSISQDGVFDSSGVAFDRTGGVQRKTVTVTATATDEKGGRATATSSIIVKFTPAAQRLDDVVFSAGSSRVNNCGKRLLLEVLASKLKSDPTAQVVLIGHMAKGEGVASPAKGKKHRTAVSAMDKARVINAAAVISAGTGICPSLDLSRVKVAYAGTDNSSPAMLGFCGTSTQVKGRKHADTMAGYRRVEVWFVPTGAKMPPSAAAIAGAPAAAVKAKGCPK